jgi:hypothetical protein
VPYVIVHATTLVALGGLRPNLSDDHHRREGQPNGRFADNGGSQVMSPVLYGLLYVLYWLLVVILVITGLGFLLFGLTAPRAANPSDRKWLAIYCVLSLVTFVAAMFGRQLLGDFLGMK